jgi:hypothetical protein
MDAGDDAELQYALAAIADESAGAGEAAAGLATLCDVLTVSGPDFILAIPHAGIAARLPALLAGSSSDGGDVPLLGARAIAEACEAVASATATRRHLESPLRAPPNRRRRRRLESPAIARVRRYLTKGSGGGKKERKRESDNACVTEGGSHLMLVRVPVRRYA